MKERTRPPVQRRTWKRKRPVCARCNVLALSGPYGCLCEFPRQGTASASDDLFRLGQQCNNLRITRPRNAASHLGVHDRPVGKRPAITESSTECHVLRLVDNFPRKSLVILSEPDLNSILMHHMLCKALRTVQGNFNIWYSDSSSPANYALGNLEFLPMRPSTSTTGSVPTFP